VSGMCLSITVGNVFGRTKNFSHVDAICFALTIPVASLRVKKASELMTKGNLSADNSSTVVNLTLDNSAKRHIRYQEPQYVITAKILMYFLGIYT